ncbi:hypothetical protein MBANPS3_002366 [Mucor bainieri]
MEPHKTAAMTEQLFELMLNPGKTSRLNHTVQCMCLLLVFAVVYTCSCINAIKNLTAPPSAAQPSSPSSSKAPASLPEPSSSPLSSSSKRPTSTAASTAPTTAKQTVIKNNNAPAKTPMRSAADLATLHDKQVGPIATNDNNNNNNNNKQSTNHAQVTPSGPPPLAPSSSATTSDADKDQLTQLINEDTIIKKQDLTVAQVIPMKAKEEHVDVAEKDQVAQPTIPVQTPEASHPQQTTPATTTTKTTPPTVVASTTKVDHQKPATADEPSKKEQYYEEINRKGNNLMAFSDNLQRIFDEPPTPSPDHHVRPFSMIQPSTTYLDEAISTTPALTPPNQSSAAGSTLSRKSSMASQNSLFKSKFNVFQKMARSSTVSTTHSNNNKQQHNDDITAVPASPPPEPSKSKRFSSIRLPRRKTTKEPKADAAEVNHTNTTATHNAPTPQKSKSNNIIKKALHRTSKIFSTNNFLNYQQ